MSVYTNNIKLSEEIIHEYELDKDSLSELIDDLTEELLNWTESDDHNYELQLQEQKSM